MAKYFLIALALLSVFACNNADSGNQNASVRGLNDGLYAKVYTTKGEILLFLDHKNAPLTVANFIGLAEGSIDNTFRGKGEPYFDGLTFHRVVPNFVIQGGDPMGNGSGGPGYAFRNEISPTLRHSRTGTLAMANSGPNTNGSQFYITHRPTTELDGNYNVFGFVVSGMDVVNKIAIGDKMDKVEIIRKGSEASDFDAPAVFEASK
jgi:peptidylprolyl isomerase